jgi:hypothetical protein
MVFVDDSPLTKMESVTECDLPHLLIPFTAVCKYDGTNTFFFSKPKYLYLVKFDRF